MFDNTKIFYLTENEVQTINYWVEKNNFLLSSGYFELHFDYGIIEDAVELLYFKEGQMQCLEVFTDDLRRNQLLTIDQVVIANVMVDLKLSKESSIKNSNEGILLS